MNLPLFAGNGEDLIDYHLGPLKPWLNKRIQDIAINMPAPDGPSEAWICQDGKWSCHAVDMVLDDVEGLALAAASYRQQEIRPAAPVLSTELPGGVWRLEVILWRFVDGGAAMVVRRRDDEVAPMADFALRYELDGGGGPDDADARLLDLYDAAKEAKARSRFSRESKEALGAFYTASVKARKNTLLVGPTNAGKSTLAEMLTQEISEDERLFIMEDAKELIVNHRNVVRILYSSGNLSGSKLTLEALVNISLRMHPDRIMLPEIRSADAAWVFILILSMGHPGIVSTMHCRTPGEAVRRLLTLGRTSQWGQGMDEEALLNLIEPAIDLIVPMRQGGKVFYLGDPWYRPAARRGGHTLADLVKEP